MHSTDNLDDGYLGSGKILGYSRHKYGDENHKLEILEMLPSREALKAREKEIVNEELLANPLNINLKYGGDGGWEYINQNLDFLRNQCQLMVKAKAEKRKDPNYAAALKMINQKTRARNQEKIVASRKNNGKNYNDHLIGKKQGEAQKQKRKITFLERGHQQGEKNSQFGTCWVTNGNPVKIKKEQLDEYLANGYLRGRKFTIPLV
jgi:hypothetical protein